MSNNNFLNGYGKKDEVAKEKIKVKNTTVPSMKYEEKSGFVKPQKKGPEVPSGSGNSSKLVLWIVLGIVAVAAIIVAIVLILSGAGVEVLNFEDWQKSDVQLWASENDIKLQIEGQYSDVFDENKVLSQSVPEGSKIKKGDFLGITVSKGHDLSVTLDLPDILNMTKEQVEAWAEENYMTKVRITTEYNDKVESGKVIRFEINDDTVVKEVRRDTPIYVIVSKGPEDETIADITVPDFKTMSLSESYIFATDNGLELVIEEKFDDYVPKGSVISQSVKAEEKVSKGDTISLIVSKGKKITVPDFSEYSKEQAQSIAAELGIPVSIKERYSGSSAGRFLSQSIEAGIIYVEGDYLELCYSIGNKIVLSSFVGQTRDAIENWANDLNVYDARITIKVTYTKNSAPAGTIIYQDKANVVIKRGTTISITVSKGSIVYVPDFVAEAGLGYGDVVTRQIAIQMCEDAGLVPIFTEENSAGRLSGEVWYQSIAAGTEVYEGSTIMLKFTPTQQTQVPDFSGMTQQEVLAGGYDKLLTITFEQSEDVIAGFEGKVYDQSIAVGTTVAKGEGITLYISAQAEPEPSPSESPEPSPSASPTPSTTP